MAADDVVHADDLIKHRDHARDDIKFATSTLSTTTRGVGIGLALLFYSVSFGEDNFGLMSDYGRLVLLASLFGVLCLIADSTQYFFLWRENNYLLTYLRKARDAGKPITVHQFEAASTNWRHHARAAAFWAKIAFALLGCSVVVFVLAEVAAPLFVAEP